MIVDFFLLLWLLGLTVPVYWAAPHAGLRLCILSCVSLLLLWTLSPLIPVTLVFYGFLIWGFARAQQSGVSADTLRRMSWGVFLPLAVLEFVPAQWFVQGLLGQTALNAPTLVGFAFLGVSYTAIRAFILIRERVNGRGASVLETTAGLTFFGSFVAGPIAGGKPWQDLQATLKGRDMLIAFSRVFWGAAMLLALKPMVEGVDIAAVTGLAPDSRAVAWLSMYRGFLALYIDFSGYSDVAIGTALLYGVKLPENFNWPLRATSIQEFWRRWHMSLGAFIGTYLFKPFVRSVGKPSRAIFLAFTAVGFWHSVTLPYFIWGVGHGAALALNMILRKRYEKRIQSGPRLVRWANVGLGWVFTISYVSFLSRFANSSDIHEAWAFVTQLF
ncbi:MAG: MBOAT family O-acyltransferase [Pelagimonas sp.]|uniref:MBOAT family O-acyltransferase n=1 Tax=Pelagimonas sp. TaxID=2073170 RepID=UPI003D6AB0F5